MTCKDCYFYNVCSEKDGTTNFMERNLLCNDVEKICQYFKDKSLIIYWVTHKGNRQIERRIDKVLLWKVCLWIMNKKRHNLNPSKSTGLKMSKKKRKFRIMTVKEWCDKANCKNVNIVVTRCSVIIYNSTE